MLELHCHTTFSDGTLTPTQLVETAAHVGVRALAITDHDTFNGCEEALIAAAQYDLEIVPGLELSTVHNNCSLHILGFYPNLQQLREPLQERLDGRKRRAQKMLDKLAELGYPVELSDRTEGMAPGRPHIAAAMVKAGYVKSSREAFSRFLRDEGLAYVHYEKFSIQEGIALLRSCGAVPVWAHPCLFRGGVLEEVLRELVEAGLMGIEVYHPSQSLHQQQRLRQLCQEYGLLQTGGSDYHGFTSEGTGSQLNMWHLPLSLLDPIKEAAEGLGGSVLKSPNRANF